MTCYHSSEQNVAIECMHRRVIGRCIALLYIANMPLDFWPYVMSIAIYFLHRLPTKILYGFSSFQLFFARLYIITS